MSYSYHKHRVGAGAGGGGGTPALNAYMYRDANVLFETKFGYGNKSNGRADLRPTQKRIIVDGTTSTVGNYYHVASIDAAKAIFAAGDWILLQGGATHTGGFGTSSTGTNPGELWASGPGGFSGTSHQNMAVIGTFDPAHNTNSVGDEAYYNTLKHTLDGTGMGTNAPFFFQNHAFHDIAIVNIRFLAGRTDATISADFTRGAGGDSYLLFENCTFDGVLASTQCSLTPTTSFTANADSALMTDVTFRFCGFMYGASSGGARNGNSYASMTRRLRYEACVSFHGGYGRDQTRSTIPYGEIGWSATPGDGPDRYKHNFYISAWNEDVRLMDCVTGWDSANSKFQGGSYTVQNLCSVRDPIPFIYEPAGGGSPYTLWPTGSTFLCDNHLQTDSDDIDTFSAAYYRGWAAQMYVTAAGSRYNGALILNADGPTSSNRQGVVSMANGQTIATALTIDSGVWGNWNYQSTSANPDAYTTVTYTNNVWESASSGSNTIYTSKPALYQSYLSNALARNIHTTLRLAFPAYFGSVTVGGSNLATEANMLEYMCNNPFPTLTDATVTSWATLIQYHFRSAFSGL